MGADTMRVRFCLFFRTEKLEWSSGFFETKEEAEAHARMLMPLQPPGFATGYKIEQVLFESATDWVPFVGTAAAGFVACTDSVEAP